VRRLPPALRTSAQGTAALPVDLASAPGNLIQPGSSWSFQFVFRDPHGTGGGPLNFSDAVRIEFTP
jgi:hypothetical protein